MPKLTKAELTLKRKAARDAMPSPQWADHNLNGITGRVTAGSLTRLTQRATQKVTT